MLCPVLLVLQVSVLACQHAATGNDKKIAFLIKPLDCEPVKPTGVLSCIGIQATALEVSHELGPV